jgi:hypothetical protein
LKGGEQVVAALDPSLTANEPVNIVRKTPADEHSKLAASNQ